MKKSFGAKTLVFPTPVWVVGSYDKQGKPNVMAVAWGGICCSNPPCVAVSLRKATYTYGNILKWKAFTVNVPSETHAREADYIGTASGRNVDKFAATGLTPVRSQFVDAPYVREFPLVLECRLLRTVEIGLHTQFIGEIVDVKADESVISSDIDESVLGAEGLPDIEKVKPMVYSPEVGRYHGIGKNLGKAYSIGKTIGKKG
ncbi:MAG TPA: flavin reductase family protein [Candidatus Limnocylindria bacterium]|nr:flavin reductase family protein [Candidatus Limnocylindria bacterium]